MFQWYAKVIRQYGGFTGRARRREFWYFALVNFLVVFVLALIAGIAGSVSGTRQNTFAYNLFAVPYLLYLTVVLIPSLAVSVRRLHDTGKSGWWLLLNLVPLGGLVLLVFFAINGDAGENKYGADPKASQTQSPESAYPIRTTE